MQQSQHRSSTPQGSGSGPAKLLPQEPNSASQHQAAIALNRVCEHLSFMSICFMHLLARCVLKYQKTLRELLLLRVFMLSIKMDIIKCTYIEFGIRESSKCFLYKLMVIASSHYTISVYEKFPRNTLLSDHGGNLYSSQGWQSELIKLDPFLIVL